MKKLFFLLSISVVTLSCRNIDKDSQAIADLKCVAYSAEDSLEIKGYEQNITEIKSHWKNADLAKLINNSNSLFAKQCTAKIEDDKKIKEMEDASKKWLESYEGQPLEASIPSMEETDAYIRESQKMMKDIENESYSTPYNGLEK